MKVKVIKSFRDKEFEDKPLRSVGETLECDDKIAQERIKKGFVEEVKKSKKKGK